MQDLALYFRALSDRKRLGIVLYLVKHEEVTVTELGEALRLSQPLISWHLGMLRRAGIVKTRKIGRQVFCSLDRASLRNYQHLIEGAFGLGDTTVDDAPNRRLEAAHRV